MTVGAERATPPTARGRVTRERIVRGAAVLIYERGIAGTSLDDVCRATSTSKSQLYHYFTDKSALVCAVIAWQQDAVLNAQQPYLGEFSTLAGLRTWRDTLVQANSSWVTFGGCPIGTLASEVAGDDTAARHAAASAFEAWRSALSAGIQRIIDGGELKASSDADSLALGLLAALQGGLLLSKATQSAHPLAVSLDHALAAIDAQRVTEADSSRSSRGRDASGRRAAPRRRT
jgi:AcrR family transcriptional regulator